jgi:hypothetical protein
VANEQAESSALETNDLAGLADFLSDTQEIESEEESSDDTVDESTGEEADTEEATNDEQTEDDAEESEESDEPAPVEKKITIKVKGEGGTDETLELTQEDIAASYLRQRDYTRKTQELAKRENDAVQFLTQKHEEIRNQYVSQAELSRAAVAQMAGIRSEAEMAQLANSDPAAWVAENQRQRQISSFLNQLDQQITGEKQQAKAQLDQRDAQAKNDAYEEAWQALSKDGIDKPKLAKIYGGITEKYGVTNEELATVYDHRFVQIMKDAVAYRELQAKKPAITKQVQNAPRMPSRQAQPAQERRDQVLNNKFKNGSAKLNDLAAFLR